LYALPKERAYFVAGREFGVKEGCIVVIVRALYGMKSSGSAFRSKLAEDLREFGYMNSFGDPDVWMRPRVNVKGHKYYEYVSVYVDDLLIFSHDPSYFCAKLKAIYKLKNEFTEPSNFLGTEVSKYQSYHGDLCWGASMQKYIAQAVSELDEKL